ncbi:undecaprenyl-diphosphatase 2 [Mycoavidus sp. B2-EB]|nr:undecaprenyl-diphosphatase 2 [Mycoavidus sp. B2-EB]
MNIDWILAFKALLLGIVEGLTEFLPVSSTGHLIVVGSLLNFTGAQAKAFDVVIQFGAILAVCWEFRRKIGELASGIVSRPNARRFILNIVVACIPAVVFGLIFDKQIKALLFTPVSVALALVIGGIVILWAEWRQSHGNKMPRVRTLDELTVTDALKVGLAQCLALIPGTSRSGSTIIGGMLFGLERRIATEFSFFLAMPLLFGATVYELYKMRTLLEAIDIGVFILGLVAAFASAFICVRWLLRYITTHDFKVFAWYRIGFGLLILITAYTGVIKWTA